MLEDVEKTIFIKQFLLEVISGMSFIEDIWIERDVKRPGTGTQEHTVFTEAYSLSRNPVSNITELLEDDISHSFEQGFFTFRFVAAIPGSGKTTLLQYLEKRIEFKKDYWQRSLLFRFDFPKNLSFSNSQNVRNNLYFHILAKTFYKILKKAEIQSVAENILREFLGNEISTELKMTSEIAFLPKFNRYFTESGIEAEELFFYLIEEVKNIKANYTFVYLIDELDDALRENSPHNEQIRSAFRSLINKAYEDHKGKIPLMIYLAGTNDIVRKFIHGNSAFERRVFDAVINLVPGLNDEFKQIKDKINQRIEASYIGKSSFEEARNQIKNIDKELNYSDNNRVLSNFCKDYAGRVLEICNHYFAEESENCFDGSINQFVDLVKAECKRQWRDYLGKYELKIHLNIIKARNFSFGCYATLLNQNGNIVANAYGGARNYNLLRVFLDNFIDQLEKENYRPNSSNAEPPDIAFIIAPDCSVFLKKILESKKIEWINSSKEIPSVELVDIPATNKTATDKIREKNNSIKINPVDINMDDKKYLLEVFKNGGRTAIGSKIIDEIIANRPYKDLEELVNKVKNIGPQRRKIIQEKLNEDQIAFKKGVFLCHNSQDKVEVKKIAAKLKERRISYWLDEEQLIAGDRWQKVLEEDIKSNKIRSAAIFIGKNGIGPWQSVEQEIFIEKCIRNNYPVIPVILPSCNLGNVDFPYLFGNLQQRIDFRGQRYSEAIEQLIRGIQGR
ncbi:hypothetical protein NIES4103_37110 [Nostoc sp. NIES-4103]|nr:hypothetical protein NIES4103_37110 [Nostoc sp. NIES-4103]